MDESMTKLNVHRAVRNALGVSMAFWAGGCGGALDCSDPDSPISQVSKIAVRSDRDGNDEIYVMSQDGLVQVRLTTKSAQDFDPDFSNDGTKIVFASGRDSGDSDAEIYVMNADGSGQTRLTTSPNWDEQPQFSPDGTKIVF